MPVNAGHEIAACGIVDRLDWCLVCDLMAAMMTASDTNFRLARPEDRHTLIEVMRRASLAVETGEVRRRLLEQPGHLDVDGSLFANDQVILAEIEDVPVGFASFIIEGSIAEIDGMFVDPNHWRCGIGRLMFAALLRELLARKVADIRVVAGANAVDFYRSMGFTIIGEEATPLGPVVPVMTMVIPQ